jgi:hypothetical protein
MSTRPRLTAEVEDKILVWIRSGAFPHVAAEAEGVPQEVFERWLARGDAPRAGPRYRRFAANVRKAVAVARLRTEIRVLEKDPKFWLLSGPGKDRPGCRGWASAVKVAAEAAPAGVNLFADPVLSGLLEALLAALAPFPEARKAAVQALAERAPAENPRSEKGTP